MKTMKLMVPALMLFVALNVTYRMAARHENSAALLLSAVEKAEASGEYEGTEAFAKLKRCSCTMPGNSITRTTQSGVSFSIDRTSGSGSKTSTRYGIDPSISHKVTVQGTEGYYTDCKFSLFKRCNRSEINFTCRE